MNEEDKDQRLGRGLSALLGEGAVDAAAHGGQGISREMSIELLELNSYQPRHRVDQVEIEALAASIRQNGILQPILVRRSPEDDDAYEIVAGERRWRAAQRAGLHQVPVIIKELTQRAALEIALVENIQRQDLTPLEEAEGYERLIENFGHTQEKLGEALGKSRSHIANALRLLELPDSVKEMLDDGRLTAGHARALLTSQDPESLAREIVAKGLNVRQAERLARRAAAGGKAGAPAPKDADTRALETDLSAALGLKVEISPRADGGGEVKIRYDFLEQLEEIRRRLGHESMPWED